MAALSCSGGASRYPYAWVALRGRYLRESNEHVGTGVSSASHARLPMGNPCPTPPITPLESQGLPTEPARAWLAGADRGRRDSALPLSVSQVASVSMMCTWIKGIAQTIANEREGEDNDSEDDGRTEYVPGIDLQG